MKSYQLITKQTIPISLQEAWDFFSSPLNLANITPGDMNFKITSDYGTDTVMYPGMLITYKISPILGIKMNWMTEITHVREGEYFVDEQRFGPYALWHHEHHFKVVKGGVEMSDILTYGIPFGIFGRLANSIFVGKKVKEIFAYREKAIERIFGPVK